MQFTTIILVLCLIGAVMASAHYERYTAEDALGIPDAAIYEYDTPAHDRSVRTKRSFLLLKKKLLLGALGLKAAKIGTLGAGVAGALALKKHHAPSWNVEVHSFTG